MTEKTPEQLLRKIYDYLMKEYGVNDVPMEDFEVAFCAGAIGLTDSGQIRAFKGKLLERGFLDMHKAGTLYTITPPGRDALRKAEKKKRKYDQDTAAEFEFYMDNKE